MQVVAVSNSSSGGCGARASGSCPADADGTVMENGEPNGHEQEVSPLKRILLRVIPELEDELETVINVFDPWARDRSEYYSLQWVARKGAEADPAFADVQ